MGVKYDINSLICEGADFKDAIVDDEELSSQLRERKAKNVPPAAKNKKELREKLKNSGLFPSLVEDVISCSILTD